MLKTDSRLRALETFNQKGLEVLNEGVGNEVKQHGAIRLARNIADLRNHLRIADIDELRGRTALVDSRWISSEIYDRCGFYQAMRSCLREKEMVSRLFDSNPAPKTMEEFRYFSSLFMFKVLVSVSDHRHGHRDSAVAIADTLTKRIAKLHQDARDRGESNPRIRLLLDQLGLRAAYALGRHCLSSGEVERADREFGRVLEFCAAIRKRWEDTRSMLVQPWLPGHVLLWTGAVMTALARAALGRGQLERAIRQLLVSRTILSNTHDEIGIGFADYLLGGVYRQMGDETRAIDQLESAIGRFRNLRHERYLKRALHEIVKAYLLAERWEKAQQALEEVQRLGERRKRILFRESPSTKKRSEANTALLWARLKLATGDIDCAEGHACDCLKAVADCADDLKIQSYAVLGEILLRKRKFSDAVRRCESGLKLKVADPADHGWIMLILTEVDLRRKQLDGAQLWFAQWRKLAEKLENRILKKRAAALEVELDAELASFYISYAEPKEFKYEDVNRNLRAFLIRHVRTFKRGSTQEDYAKALGITRQTYSNWLAELTELGLIDG